MHLSTQATAPAPTRRLALHRRELRAQDYEVVGTFGITTPLCTALDLATGGIAQDLFDEVVCDGVAIGRIDPEKLRPSASDGRSRSPSASSTRWGRASRTAHPPGRT